MREFKKMFDSILKVFTGYKCLVIKYDCWINIHKCFWCCFQHKIFVMFGARGDGHHYDVTSKYCGVTITTCLVEWTLSVRRGIAQYRPPCRFAMKCILLWTKQTYVFAYCDTCSKQKPCLTKNALPSMHQLAFLIEIIFPILFKNCVLKNLLIKAKLPLLKLCSSEPLWPGLHNARNRHFCNSS